MSHPKLLSIFLVILNLLACSFADGAIKLEWFDPSGHVLDLSWRTASYWVWEEGHGRSLQPLLQVWLEVPKDFNPTKVSEGTFEQAPERLSFLSDSPALHLIVRSSLITVRLHHVLPSGESEEGVLTLSVEQPEATLLVHSSCGSDLNLRRRSGAGQFLFLALRCENAGGRVQAILRRSEEASWSDPQTGISIETSVERTIMLKPPFDSSAPLAEVGVLSAGASSLYVLEARSPVEVAVPARRVPELKFSGHMTPGELIGESSIATFRELNLFLDLRASYTIPKLWFSSQTRVRSSLGSLLSPHSSFLHELDAKAGLSFDVSPLMVTIGPGLHLFVFRNEEIRPDTLGLVGPSLELALSSVDYRFWFSVAILGESLGQVSSRKVQWETGFEIPLRRSDSGGAWAAHLGLMKLSEWDSADFQLAFVFAGIGATL